MYLSTSAFADEHSHWNILENQILKADLFFTSLFRKVIVGDRKFKSKFSSHVYVSWSGKWAYTTLWFMLRYICMSGCAFGEIFSFTISRENKVGVGERGETKNKILGLDYNLGNNLY